MRGFNEVIMYNWKLNNIIKEMIHWLLLAILLMWSFYPILYIALSSFKLPMDIWNYPPKLIGSFSFENYRELILERPEYFIHLKNSLIITTGTCLMTLFCAIPAAFALSRYKNIFLKSSAFFLIAIRMLPPIVIIIPLFPLFNSLRLIDKHITLIILYSVFVVSISTWIMKVFIDNIPIELEEAAMIDGCSKLQAFMRITLPLIKPGVIAVVLFSTILAWNEYFFAFLFTSTVSRTAPLTIADFLGSIMGMEWGQLLAASVIQLIPILILTLIMQEYLVKGMTLGSIK